MCKPICLVVATLLLGLSASAQNSEKAGKAFTKAKKAYSEGDFKEWAKQIADAIELEGNLGENADRNFIGEVFYYSGQGLISESTYGSASQMFYRAAISYAKAKNGAMASNARQQASYFYDSCLKYQSSFLRATSEKMESVMVHFPIDKVLKTALDTTWFSFKLGTRDSIKLGQKASIITSYMGGKNSENGNTYFGQVVITKVDYGRSEGYVVIDKTAKEKGITLQPKDHIFIQTFVREKIYKGLLFDMAKLNIVFTDDYKIGMYNIGTIGEIISEASENAILDMMVDVVQTTAKSIKEDPEMYSKINSTIADGAFKNIGTIDAMLLCTRDDISAFLRFVKAFPAKYMGGNYRIDETYATWLINSTPTGDNEARYLLDEYKSISTTDELKNWLETRSRYLDVAGFDYDKINQLIYDYVNQNQFPQADSLTGIWKNVVTQNENTSQVYNYEMIEAWIASSAKNYDKSISDYEKIIKKYDNYWYAHLQLGHVYLEKEAFGEALKHYQVAIDSAPEYADGHGSYGWTMLKMGRFAKAEEYLQTAYLLDSSNPTYIMNYAHCMLLTNRHAKARKLYDYLMEHIESKAVFEKGLIADLDFFIENGWETELLSSEKKYLLNLWNNHFKNLIEAKELYETGKKLSDNEKYQDAAVKFDQASVLAEDIKDFSKFKLRSYYRYAGYNYYKLGNHQEGLSRYTKAWDISRKYLDDVESEISDIESIKNEYDWLDNEVMQDMFQKMQNAAQRKLNSQNQNSTVFIVSVGVNDALGSYTTADDDALAIAELLKTKSKLIFDTSVVVSLVNEKATLQELKKSFDLVIANSRPGDCFILYFSGYCPQNFNGIILHSDTIKNRELLAWISSMQADKKLILIDAANAQIVPDFIAKQRDLGDVFNAENITFLVSDGRVEMPATQGGLFTSYLIQGLSGGATTQWNNGFDYVKISASNQKEISFITSKSLEGYMYGNLSAGNLKFDLKSYSSGVDFPLTFTSSLGYSIDTIPPMIFVPNAVGGEGKRGGKTKLVTVKNQLTGQALDESGIDKIRINGLDIEFNQNGKFVYNLHSVGDWAKVVVSAIDKKGNVATDSFLVNITHIENEEPKLEEETQTNYALMFATSNFDEWNSLDNPQKDVEAIANLLRSNYDFSVEIVLDATKDEMKKKLLEYFRKNYTSKDQLFVYFAGHGHFDPSLGGHIVCADSKKDDPTMDSYIPYDFIVKNLDRTLACKHIFVALDVCYGGEAFDKNTSTTNYNRLGTSLQQIRDSQQSFVNDKLKYTSRVFATSGGIEYVPDESVFAKKIIETLQSKGDFKNGLLTFDDFTDNLQTISSIPNAEIPTHPRFGSFGSHDPKGDFILKYVERNGVTKSGKNSPKMELN